MFYCIVNYYGLWVISLWIALFRITVRCEWFHYGLHCLVGHNKIVDHMHLAVDLGERVCRPAPLGFADPLAVWRPTCSLETFAPRSANLLAWVCRTPRIGCAEPCTGANPPTWVFSNLCLGSADPPRGCKPRREEVE